MNDDRRFELFKRENNEYLNLPYGEMMLYVCFYMMNKGFMIEKDEEVKKFS
jgi:hypothetical protein